MSSSNEIEFNVRTRNVMSSIRCETRKRKIRVQCRRVCRDTQEGIPKRIYLLERISRSCSFPLLAYSRSCPIVFPFPLLHSRSLSCMRTCHNFCDRYYKPTETNLFFSSNTRPQCPRISTDHPVFMLSSSNALGILFRVTNVKLF